MIIWNNKKKKNPFRQSPDLEVSHMYFTLTVMANNYVMSARLLRGQPLFHRVNMRRSWLHSKKKQKLWDTFW